ncbi:MAG: hypothetical protein V9G24_11720 [Rhodoblastus sp.]
MAARCRKRSKALLVEIIAKVNDLFEGELTDDDKLVYVNNVLKGKLLESDDYWCSRRANNTKEQFANSPDLKPAHDERHHGRSRRSQRDEQAGA